jgi:hypothetical protein
MPLGGASRLRAKKLRPASPGQPGEAMGSHAPPPMEVSESQRNVWEHHVREGLFVSRFALSCPLPLPRLAKARGWSVSVDRGGRYLPSRIPARRVDPLPYGIAADPLWSLAQCPLECSVLMPDVD